MKPGRLQLAEWKVKRGVTQREMAELFKVHENFVSLMLKGKRRPGLTLAVAIENLTGVPVRSWTLEKLSNSETAISPMRVK